MYFTYSRLLPGVGVERKISGCRCHFRTFQLELDNLGTKNFGIGSVVEKLQPFEFGSSKIKHVLFFYNPIIWYGHEQNQ